MQPNLDTRASMMDKLVLVKPCVLLLQDAHLIIFVVVAMMVAQLIREYLMQLAYNNWKIWLL